MQVAGDALGFAIANLITLFAPPKVILTGAALSASNRLLTPLRAAVLRFTPASFSDVAKIVVRDFGDDIWARGAAALMLRELYGAEGITGDKDIVVYCRIGERSSHSWFVLHELLGYPNVRNYDGSWTEWGNVIRVPIER